MADRPDFLRYDRLLEIADRSYRPHPPERKGETLAWLCTGGVLLGGLIFQLRSGSFPEIAAGLSVAFGLTAALITFGNWMEAGTSIRVTHSGIHYRSPLRDVPARWTELNGLRAVPLQRGWRVVVISEVGRFIFRTPTTLSVASSGAMPIGITDGIDLVRTIVSAAQLEDMAPDGEGWVAKRSDR